MLRPCSAKPNFCYGGTEVYAVLCSTIYSSIENIEILFETLHKPPRHTRLENLAASYLLFGYEILH